MRVPHIGVFCCRPNSLVSGTFSLFERARMLNSLLSGTGKAI